MSFNMKVMCLVCLVTDTGLAAFGLNALFVN